MSERRPDRQPWRGRLPRYTVDARFVELAETVDWSLAAYDVPRQWRQSRGAGIKVAVLDTGIDTEHPDLREALDDARDFTRGRGGPVDRVGHGTHVAGTIAARENSVGLIGVAPECRLLIGKVLADDGGGSDSDVAAGIDWAVEEGANLINLSLGAPSPSLAIHAAVERATEQGVFVICAAGNEGRPNSVSYPARWETTVAVAAVDRHGRAARFSSRGPEVDIAAPGQDILSTYLDGGYAKLSGTSMAAPFVTGVVALALAKHRRAGGRTPIRTLADLLEHLGRTATDAGPRGHDPNFGWGLIHPDRLLETTAEAAGDEFVLGGLTLNGRDGVLVFRPLVTE